MSILTRPASLRLSPSIFAAAFLLALPGCPPADPGGESAAPAVPAATAPPASDSGSDAAPADAGTTEAAGTEAAATDAGDGAADADKSDEKPAEDASAGEHATAEDGNDGDGTHKVTEGMIDEVFGAFKAGNFDKIETYRAKLDAPVVDELMTHYKTSLSWEIKDGFTHLMLHRYEAVVIPLMEDSLKSKRVESRAQAIATLRQAKDMIGTMHDDKGGIDPSKVADAIKEYRSENPG
jgi:hypothetical protein